MGRQHPSRNRGDVSPLVEFLQQKCCRNRCRAQNRPSDRRTVKQVPLGTPETAFGSFQSDCATTYQEPFAPTGGYGEGISTTALRTGIVCGRNTVRVLSLFSVIENTRTSGFIWWKVVEVFLPF
jgi:hypothetical protein